MRRTIIIMVSVLLAAGVVAAQSQGGHQPHNQNQQVHGHNTITHGQFAQMVLDIALGYEEATPDPETALEKLQGWGLAPATWSADDILTHGQLAAMLNQVGIDYMTPGHDKAVSAGFVKALLWREIGKLRDYMARRLGHGFSANHVLDSGVDRAVSPSDYD